MICPPSIVKRPKKGKKFSVQSIILNWLKQFANPNGAIASIQDLKARLSFDMPPACIEQALCDLAPLLGAEGSRPEKEYGQGPDDLWLWPDPWAYRCSADGSFGARAYKCYHIGYSCSSLVTMDYIQIRAALKDNSNKRILHSGRAKTAITSI